MGFVVLPAVPVRPRARRNSSVTTKQRTDTEAEVDKFINDNNEDDEDDDNINN